MLLVLVVIYHLTYEAESKSFLTFISQSEKLMVPFLIASEIQSSVYSFLPQTVALLISLD